MDIVINEDDIKTIVGKFLETEGYTVELINLGFDPQLTNSTPGMSPAMSRAGMFGGQIFDNNNPSRPKLALLAKVNKNEVR